MGITASTGLRHPYTIPSLFVPLSKHTQKKGAIPLQDGGDLSGAQHSGAAPPGDPLLGLDMRCRTGYGRVRQG